MFFISEIRDSEVYLHSVGRRSLPVSDDVEEVQLHYFIYVRLLQMWRFACLKFILEIKCLLIGKKQIVTVISNITLNAIISMHQHFLLQKQGQKGEMIGINYSAQVHKNDKR